MVIVHIDNTVYTIDEGSPTISKKLQQFYHLKFEKILKSSNDNSGNSSKLFKVAFKSKCITSMPASFNTPTISEAPKFGSIQGRRLYHALIGIVQNNAFILIT